MNTETLKATVEREFPGLTTKEAIVFAKAYLQLPDEGKKLLITIMDMAIGNPERLKFAAAWKGKMTDLPAALAQI